MRYELKYSSYEFKEEMMETEKSFDIGSGVAHEIACSEKSFSQICHWRASKPPIQPLKRCTF